LIPKAVDIRAQLGQTLWVHAVDAALAALFDLYQARLAQDAQIVLILLSV